MLREHPRETGGVTRSFAGRRGTGQEKRLRKALVFRVESGQRQVAASCIFAHGKTGKELERAVLKSMSRGAERNVGCPSAARALNG